MVWGFVCAEEGAQANTELTIGILAFHKLKVSDFATEEEAMKCAMDYINLQRDIVPDIIKRHPDIKMPSPKASLYWYVMSGGLKTNWKKVHTQKYEMNAKLNDKYLKSIADHGSQDQNLGMLVPHSVDMVQVKKEMQSIDELENVKKTVESTYTFQLAPGPTPNYKLHGGSALLCQVKVQECA